MDGRIPSANHTGEVKNIDDGRFLFYKCLSVTQGHFWRNDLRLIQKRSPKNRTQMKPKIETSRNESLCPLKTLDHLFFKGEMSPEIGTPFRNEDDFISEKSENIKVAIRVRPLTKEENESEEAVSVLDVRPIMKSMWIPLWLTRSRSPSSTPIPNPLPSAM